MLSQNPPVPSVCRDLFGDGESDGDDLINCLSNALSGAARRTPEPRSDPVPTTVAQLSTLDNLRLKGQQQLGHNLFDDVYVNHNSQMITLKL